MSGDESVGEDIWAATGAERPILTERCFSQHGKVAATEGYLSLTSERLFFTGQAGRVTQGGALAQLIADRMAGGKGVDIALTDITAVRRTRHGFGRNVLDVEVRGGEVHRFVPGWKKFPGPLREALQAQGRTVSDVGTDEWQVE